MPDTREKLKETLIVLLVAAQDTAERICNAKPCIECAGHEYACCEAALTADALIADGVTIQKWIPVTERLPSNGDIVLVFAQYPFDERGTITVAEYEPENKVFWGIVSHWMPLPEPPKEGSV